MGPDKHQLTDLDSKAVWDLHEAESKSCNPISVNSGLNTRATFRPSIHWGFAAERQRVLAKVLIPDAPAIRSLVRRCRYWR